MTGLVCSWHCTASSKHSKRVHFLHEGRQCDSPQIAVGFLVIIIISIIIISYNKVATTNWKTDDRCTAPRQFHFRDCLQFEMQCRTHSLYRQHRRAAATLYWSHFLQCSTSSHCPNTHRINSRQSTINIAPL